VGHDQDVEVDAGYWLEPRHLELGGGVSVNVGGCRKERAAKASEGSQRQMQSLLSCSARYPDRPRRQAQPAQACGEKAHQGGQSEDHGCRWRNSAAEDVRHDAEADGGRTSSQRNSGRAPAGENCA
jgi:hypothetical protein